MAKLLFNKHYNTKTVFQIQECQYKWISKAGLILVVCLCGLRPQRNEEKLELVFEKSPFSLFLGARHCTAILCHTSVMLSKEVSKELFWVWHSLKRVPAMMILSQRDREYLRFPDSLTLLPCGFTGFRLLFAQWKKMSLFCQSEKALPKFSGVCCYIRLFGCVIISFRGEQPKLNQHMKIKKWIPAHCTRCIMGDFMRGRVHSTWIANQNNSGRMECFHVFVCHFYLFSGSKIFRST